MLELTWARIQAQDILTQFHLMLELYPMLVGDKSIVLASFPETLKQVVSTPLAAGCVYLKRWGPAVGPGALLR